MISRCTAEPFRVRARLQPNTFLSSLDLWISEGHIKKQTTHKTMKTKTKTIEFNAPNAELKTIATPWQNKASTTVYKDLLLKPEYAPRRFKFPVGSTWCRIVPALKSSARGWMLGIHALEYPGGRHAHPRSITPGAKSVFDHAYAWLKEHRSGDLYSKINRSGYKLLPDPVCLFWMLIVENGKTVARLFQASGYDGSRGGVPGLGHQIWQLTREAAEDVNSGLNPADPELGAQICVEKRQTPGVRYPSYTVRLGRISAPINLMIERMESQEVSALVPLEEVVHVPTEDEEWAILGQIMDAEAISEIRSSIG